MIAARLIQCNLGGNSFKRTLLTEAVVQFRKFSTVVYSFVNKKPHFNSRHIIMSNKAAEMKAPLKFTDYDCIGFDLDNTLVRYKVGNMIKMEYQALADYLVHHKNYSPKHLHRPLEEDIDFLKKGLILDFTNGNVVRIASDGAILQGSHGTVQLNQEELIKYYGPNCRWNVTDTFAQDPLHTWNGPLSERMRSCLDYFDMPASLVFARAVDTVDEQNGGKLPSYNVWPDVLGGLFYLFTREHFAKDIGGYFPHMKANPDNYIYKCSDAVLNWLYRLKAENKVLFMITGSNMDFANHTASYCLGPNWHELFDSVIYFAKKPGFFTQGRPFLELDGFFELEPVDSKHLNRNCGYSGGNWSDLQECLKKWSKKSDPRVLYVGDNLVQDVFTPSVHTNCETVAVVEELHAEGACDFPKIHTDQKFLTSSRWGSYLSHEGKDTIWGKIVKKYARACVPDLEHVARQALDHEFHSLC